MTPRELSIDLKAAAWRRDQEVRLATATGWFTESFQRTRRLPKLSSILAPEAHQSPANRAERQISLLQQLAAANGGEFLEVKRDGR